MHLVSLLVGSLCASLTTAIAVTSPTKSLERRQSTTWQDACGSPAPSDFRAFNVGNCQAQLTFARGKNIGVQWNFDAIYPDGSSFGIPEQLIWNANPQRIKYNPIRNFNNIAVSDPFYTLGYGNNYLTNRTQSQAFTSVHEFTNVCKGSTVPSAWIFYTSSANSACTPKNYRFTTRQIQTQSGTRPARTSFSGRSIDSAGNIEVSWQSVSGAKAYTVFVQIPTSQYEDGSGYFTTDRGARFSGTATRGTFPGVVSFRNEEEPRRVYVNVMNTQGIWSYTPDTVPIDVYI